MITVLGVEETNTKTQTPFFHPHTLKMESHGNTMISTRLAFLLVSFSLGQLGDGLNIFQGIYLVGVGWAEGAVGTALSLMGLTSLVMQPFAGNWVDTTTIDRRWFLVLASFVTACSASTILFVHPETLNHALIYTSKVVEGIASSFINPCLAALTLACFGPKEFDEVMASNVYWGHVGSVAAAILAGIVAVIGFPHVEYCFLVIGASALVAIVFVPYLPQGDPLLGRGLDTSETPSLHQSDSDTDIGSSISEDSDEYTVPTEATPLAPPRSPRQSAPEVASYWDVFSEYKTCILCTTGFFFQYVITFPFVYLYCSNIPLHPSHTYHRCLASQTPTSCWSSVKLWDRAAKKRRVSPGSRSR